MDHSDNVKISPVTPIHQNRNDQDEPDAPSPSTQLYPWRNIHGNVLLPSFSHSQYYSPTDEPELEHLSFLISALMLGASLAFFAGVDAKVHCHSQQVYEINTLFDDDGVIYTQLQRIQEEDSCHRMFRYVMIPVTVVTLFCGALSQCIIKRHFSLKHKEALQQYRMLVQLLCIAFLILISWTYGIFSIMLRPKSLSRYNNQFQSLAAVDQMGHVGDNANLYYLSWICMGLALAIVYHLAIETNRQYKRLQLIPEEPPGVEVTATTSFQLQLYRTSRESWYHSLYRLRIRSGIWVAALLATTVVLASSTLLWRDVLVPAASTLSGERMAVVEVCRTIASSGYKSRQTLPPELCARTAFSILSGGTAALLCLTAIIIHMSTRHTATQVIHFGHVIHDSILGGPLKVEFVLSVLLSLLLGLNAVFATGVQGPAASVGNLYYASWISFLLCLRILLGCLEEMYNLGKEDSGDHEQSSVSTDAASAVMTPDLFDNDRARKSRRYLVLGIVSTICSASALDACLNQSSDLSWDQWYVIVAPTVIAILCSIQFAMCLGPISYVIISSNLIGGTLAVFMFLVWLVDLIITMHSKRSWAVNAIGDIKIANLYYFSWASIVTAGLHLSTFYVKILSKIGVDEKDFMTVIWGVMVKVCVVILGASFHIWHNIQGSCSLQDIQAGAMDFCSRTVFALMVSLVGMAVGGTVVLTRVCVSLCCPAFPSRIRSHVEMIIACFLVLVFGVALAVVTGIGGPGQSVGDLFYATWLAFLVSLGIGLSCFGEIQRQMGSETVWQQEKSVRDSEWRDGGEPDTNFVQLTHL